MEGKRRDQSWTCFKRKPTGFLIDAAREVRRIERGPSPTPGFWSEQLELPEMRESVGAAGGEAREAKPGISAGPCEGHWPPAGHPGGHLQWAAGAQGEAQAERQIWEHPHRNSRYWIQSGQAPKGERERKEKRTKDRAWGQHTLPGQVAKEESAKETERDSEKQEQNQAVWEQRRETVSRRRQ